MAAHNHFGHKALMHKTSNEKQEMLFGAGVNFNDYPAAFKRGTFVRRQTVSRTLGPDELAAIPERHRPAPDAAVTRSHIVEIEMPRFMSVSNRAEVIFDGAEPVVFSEAN